MSVGLYIPCFNAERSIADVLQAVFRQKLLPQEVIVVDDDSTDKTCEIAGGFPVKIVRHKENRGLAATRNTAIKNINTEFVASLDADCVPNYDWLEKLMKGFSSTKTVGVGGKLLEKHSASVFDLWRSVHMKQYWQRKKQTPKFLFGSNTVFRKKALSRVKLYKEKLKNNYEDVDICNRLKKRGYSFYYKPDAVVHHIKRDTIYSLFNNYWRWNFIYYKQKKYYSSQRNFSRKIKDNIGLANRYLREDIAAGRQQLLYLDFLLGLHHSLKDFAYFNSGQEGLNSKGISELPIWLSLVDLTFFYHFDAQKKQLSTLIPKEDGLLQNFLALNLVLAKIIRDRFKSKRFKRILYKHLIRFLYPEMEDEVLLGKLLNLVEFRPQWNQFCAKKHPNLNANFLRNLSDSWKKWLDSLTFTYPEIIKMIEKSGIKTDKQERSACHEG